MWWLEFNCVLFCARTSSISSLGTLHISNTQDDRQWSLAPLGILQGLGVTSRHKEEM